MRKETQKGKALGMNQGLSKKIEARQALNSGKLLPIASHLSSLFLNYTIQPVINQGIVVFAVLVARPGGVA